jgi:ketosteroid isomerase-like protein
MKKILTVLAMTGILFSCKQPASNTAIVVKAPIDSLVANWQNNWNNNDSSGVCAMFAPDVILIDDGLIVKNMKELAEKWVAPNIHIVKNLKTEKLQDWSTNDRAGFTGKYELDIIMKGTVVAHPHGVFTLNWLKTDKGNWGITTANINAFAAKQ